MSIQIYQIEKSQAIDLLDRVADRMLQPEFRDGWDDDDIISEACDQVMSFTREIDRMTTEFTDKTLTFSEVMELAKHFEDLTKHGHGSAVGFFARHLSNFNVDVTSAMLNAGYTLPERDKLCFEVEGLYGTEEIDWKVL